MTQAEVTAAYNQLLATDPATLEEGAAFAFQETPADRREPAQAWLALSRSLWLDAGGAAGADLLRMRAQRQQALAVAYLIARGVDPAQLPALAPPAAAPAPAQTLVDNLVAAMRRSLPLLPGELARQVEALLSPASIAIMTGAFAGWAVAHAFGVGAVADLLVAALGVAFLGWDALKAAKLLYGFLNHCMPPAGPQALDAAAREFAELVVLVGVDVVSTILLGQVFKKARTKLEKPKAGEPRVREKASEQTREPQAGEKIETKTLGDLGRGGGLAGAARRPLPVGLLVGGGLLGAAALLWLLRSPPPPRRGEESP